MRRTFLLTTFASFLVLAPTASAQTEPRPAAGVAAAGIDVSGLTLAEAANRIAYVFSTPINSPLSSRVAGRRFLMRPKEVDFKFDAKKPPRRAYNAGRTAAGAPVNVPLYVTFKVAKVRTYVDKVEKGIAQAPRDARVDIKLTKIANMKPRDGRTI